MKISRWALALIAVATAFPQTCAIPDRDPRTRPSRVDYRNQTSTDYYMLALSWSPAYCEDSRGRSPFQCTANKFGFVVHGLWPQSAKARDSQGHPRNCKATPEQLPGSLVRRYMCIIPDAQLIQDEWNKHGACAFTNAATYLERQKTLWDSLQKPDLANLRGYVKARMIREAWVAANQRIGMKIEHVAIDVERGGDNKFEEVRICYDKQFALTRCLARGAPDDIDVKIIAKPR